LIGHLETIGCAVLGSTDRSRLGKKGFDCPETTGCVLPETTGCGHGDSGSSVLNQTDSELGSSFCLPWNLGSVRSFWNRWNGSDPRCCSISVKRVSRCHLTTALMIRSDLV